MAVFSWPSVLLERTDAVGRVVDAGGVVQRLNTDGRVFVAFGVVLERTDAVGRVVDAGGIVEERFEHRWPC